jgi:hypothetical protein
LVSLGLVLSEEKIFEKVYDGRRTNDDDGRQVMACNFEVNLITHLGVIALFSSNL